MGKGSVLSMDPKKELMDPAELGLFKPIFSLAGVVRASCWCTSRCTEAGSAGPLGRLAS
jgi:hypothetical protein